MQTSKNNESNYGIKSKFLIFIFKSVLELLHAMYNNRNNKEHTDTESTYEGCWRSLWTLLITLKVSNELKHKVYQTKLHFIPDILTNNKQHTLANICFTSN